MNRDTDKAGWSYGKSYADLETKRPGGHGCVAVVWCGDTQCVRSCSPAQPKRQAKRVERRGAATAVGAHASASGPGWCWRGRQ